MAFFEAVEEFQKNAQLKKEDLTHLKEWISKQPHLPQVTGKYTQLSINVNIFNHVKTRN